MQLSVFRRTMQARREVQRQERATERLLFVPRSGPEAPLAYSFSAQAPQYRTQCCRLFSELLADTRHALVCSQRVEVFVGNKDIVSAQRLLQDDARLLNILREKLEQVRVEPYESKLPAGALQQYESRTSPQDERVLQQVKFQHQGLLYGSLQVEASRRSEGGRWRGMRVELKDKGRGGNECGRKNSKRWKREGNTRRDMKQ
eukprot:3268243-Pleurochrysis_carterae.AAC.1